MGIGNDNGNREMAKWALPVLLSAGAIVISLVVNLLAASSFGSRYAERVDQQGATFANRMDQLERGIDARLTALSARLNSQEEGVRTAAVLAARQDVQLTGIEKKIDERGIARDRQIEEISKQLDDARIAMTASQIASARIESLVGRLLNLQDGGSGGPVPRGRN